MNDQPCEAAFTLLIWGDSQAGKSTLAAAMLCADESRLTVIDRAKSAPAINRTLFPYWRRLRTGRCVQPTGIDHIDVDLVTRSGRVLRLRDTMGQLTRTIEQDRVAQIVQSADAFLLVVEWGSRDLARQMDAADSARRLACGKPMALVFTKCERCFAEEDEVWQARPGWWREAADLSEHRHVLESFGEAVFPTSSYGYHPRTALPALAIGEYGQLIPFGISPRGVWEPIEWLLARTEIG